jgi:two-component system, cell cycle response regulator DivK
VTKVLYVEDNDDNVYMMKMQFELLDGFEFMTAEDGEAGYVKARVELPDLILMDLDLPIVDGWELTRRLKSDSTTRHIPVIALTAHAMAGSREQALAVGCDEFDTKPINFERFMKKVDLLLGSRRAGG